MVKVKRSFPAPNSLKEEAQKINGSYNGKDVVSRLREDFHDKCYICEMKGLSDPEVDHLLPHKGRKYPERVFDWNNLFLCCRHCNQVKNKNKYDDGIIDCCKQDPEKLLTFYIQEDAVNVKPVDAEDVKAELTAELINETFNMRNSGIREAACEKRIEQLNINMNLLYKELDKYKKFPDTNRSRRALKAMLRRDSAFAAFKRNYVRERLTEYPQLKEWLE